MKRGSALVSFSSSTNPFRLFLVLALLWSAVANANASVPAIYFSQNTVPARPPLEVSNAESSTTYPAASLAKDFPEVQSEWLSAVQSELRHSEYRVSWQNGTTLPDLPGAYQAPNRAQNLRTYFTAEGIRVVPRTDNSQFDRSPSWQFGLALTSFGQGESALAAGPADLVVAADRVEYRRSGITEWYVNSEKGLEQGFVIAGEPRILASDEVKKDGQETDLSIKMAISGNVEPQLVHDGRTVEFFGRGGALLVRYSELHAFDATGRELPSFLNLLNSGSKPIEIAITIDTTNAVYPIIVDPLATSPAWSAESDQANALLGFSIKTAGDVDGDGYSDVIVGAPYFDDGLVDEGKAFVYLGSPAGLSASPAWSAVGGQTNAAFGYSVSIAGNVNGDNYSDVIVGSPNYTDTLANEGKVSVFYGSASGPSNSPDWSKVGGQNGANFGFSVSTAGDVNGDGYSDIVVGSPNYTTTLIGEGKAFVFFGSGSGLNAAAGWSDKGGQTNANFGYSVSVAGDVNGDGYSDIIVGSPNFTATLANEGGAFVYHGAGSGLSATPAWTVLGGQANANFGYSVSIAGDVNGDGYSDVIVGAPNYNNTLAGEGRATVFHGSASGLNSSADWSKDGGQANANFGYSVSIAGDVNGDGYSDVIVGAPNYNNTLAGEGRATVFHGSASGLNSSADWSKDGGQANAKFGNAVGTAGDVNGDGYSDVIVGAPFYQNSEIEEGRAFIFLGAPASLGPGAAWTTTGNNSASYFGWSVNSAGDVNGDGYSDFLIGAPLYDNGQGAEGVAFLYLGAADGPGGTPAWMGKCNQADSYYGYSVSGAGDVNGDGYGDVIVGAPNYSAFGPAFRGKVFLYLGSATGLNASSDWSAENGIGGAFFGKSVASAGDVNGDGYSDVIIGAPTNSAGTRGRAYVYHGASTGLGNLPDWTFTSPNVGGYFGSVVNHAGDVNGDGYSDVIVGASNYTDAWVNQGKAFVFYGSVSGLSTSISWTKNGELPMDEFATSANTAGDLNGDGYSDIVIGAPSYGAFMGVTPYIGRAYVYFGSPTGLGTNAAWTVDGDEIGCQLGRTAATAGDVNGDGYSDLLIAAPYYSTGGKAYLFLGSPGGPGGSPDWTAIGDQQDAWFALFAASLGDINGDGYADIIVGEPGFDSPLAEAGRVFLYYGNGGGLSVRPRQMRTNGLTEIAAMGFSDSTTAMKIEVTGRTPLGRDKVKLQWQMALAGTPLTSTGILSGTSATWTDVLTAGVPITETVNGLSPSNAYHWRARLLYPAGNLLGQQAGRWLTGAWNSVTETDFVSRDIAITGLAMAGETPSATGIPSTFTVTVSTGTDVTYRWRYGDGSVATGALVTHTYASPGTYSVAVTATNNASVVTATTTIEVAEPISGLVATSSSPTVRGDTTTLTASIAAGNSVTYTWAYGDGTTGTGAVASHTYANVGTYNAVVTATNSVSAITATTSVFVDETILGLAANNNSPTGLGNATTLTATITDGSNVTYAWSFGDGSAASGQTVTHNYVSRGLFTAIVTATNSLGTSYASTQVTVNNAPTPGVTPASTTVPVSTPTIVPTATPTPTPTATPSAYGVHLPLILRSYSGGW